MAFRFRWNPFAAKKAVQDAGKTIQLRAAEFMAERARAYVPMDTGALKTSIQIVNASGSTKVHVVATEHYAQFVEFGHIAGAGTWVAPNPFMRKALSDTAKAFPEIVRGVRVTRPDGEGSSLGATFTK